MELVPLYCTCVNSPPLISFPTRRSSDLKILCEDGVEVLLDTKEASVERVDDGPIRLTVQDGRMGPSSTRSTEDRKSTRLNSSHVKISYAVFCLKKNIGGHLVLHLFLRAT